MPWSAGHVAWVRILALDTSTRRASVAVTGGRALATSEIETAQHAETLMAQIDETLARASVSRAEIDLIAVGLGPGSFTGVRVGVAMAKGLAIGLGRPIVGVRTSAVLAAMAEGARVVVALDGKKGEVFASAWTRDAGSLACLADDANGEPRIMGGRMRACVGGAPVLAMGTTPQTLSPFAEALREGGEVVERVVTPSAAVLAATAESRFIAHGPDDLATLEPVYVRAADVTMPARP